MKTVYLIFIVHNLVTCCLSQTCPPPPTLPENVVLPTGAGSLRAREEAEDERFLENSWFTSPQRNRRAVDQQESYDTQSEVQVVSHRRVKRQSRIRRREYREMTSRQMQTWHRCLQKMKSSGIYDNFTLLHRNETSPGAHDGVAFLGWHRVYIWLFEQKMRTIKGCRKVYIPYWDSALDSHLPKPEDSVLWSNEFWGNHNGPVTSGRLSKNWKAFPGDCKARGLIIKRNITKTGEVLYSRQRILDLQAAKSFKDFVIRQERGQNIIEKAHDRHHCYVGTCNKVTGGHIANLTCSPNDPIFYMLHAMVDYIWDEWVRLPGRRNTYPRPGRDGVTLEDMAEGKNANATDHLANAPMKPFVNKYGKELKNRDGFSRQYKSVYTVRPSKKACSRDEDCRSPKKMLFCDRCNRCTSKVREGGRCDNLGSKGCYCSKGTPECKNDICVCKS